MELLRSQDMQYVSITMTNESAHATVKEIGRMGKFHVVDLSGGVRDAPNKHQQSYKKRVADCLYWERKLATIKDEMDRNSIYYADVDPVEIQVGDVLDSVAQFITPIEQELVVSMTFQRENNTIMAEAVERLQVLRVISRLRLTPEDQRQAIHRRSLGDHSEMVELAQSEDPASNVNERFRNVIAGVLPVTAQGVLTRALFRVSRGNALTRFVDLDGTIKDPKTGEEVRKSVFYVVVLGQQLLTRITRTCETVGATIYPVPETSSDCNSLIGGIQQELIDKQHVNQQTQAQIINLLTRLGSDNGRNPLKDWQNALSQEKAICNVLMKAHYYLTMIAIEGWCPVSEVRALKQAVKAAVAGTGQVPAAIETDPANPIHVPGSPPTYFELNKFTSTFQGIVDTYGVPRYKEINPGLFTIITFPFLFGVMYGDIGHGTILTAFALALVLNENKIDVLVKKGQLGEIGSMAYGGRYALLMMGAFAVYCGIIYNDCFSISLNLYGSSFHLADSNHTEYIWDGTTYPLGLDPEWNHKQNELAFYNSFKMKMAVSLGVTHMLFGIVLSLFNHLYFKDYLSVFLEFLPRIIFMCCTFGYMVWMILYKWCVDWRGVSPPNLIQTMINMFLHIGTVEPSQQLYVGQAAFQTLLVLVAVLSVPVMLLGKPLMKRHLNQKQGQLLRAEEEPLEAKSPSIVDEDSKETAVGDAAHVHVRVDATENHEEHSFGDEMIHQAIHTIEFVLGAVSNTASYLRLWALSLAHAQLSKVFWDKMILQYGIEGGSALGALVGFAIWAGATFAVLLCMDVLECFLHALRLHWVEFQGKFYGADGQAFDPFTFDSDANKA